MLIHLRALTNRQMVCYTMLPCFSSWCGECHPLYTDWWGWIHPESHTLHINRERERERDCYTALFFINQFRLASPKPDSFKITSFIIHLCFVHFSTVGTKKKSKTFYIFSWYVSTAVYTEQEDASLKKFNSLFFKATAHRSDRLSPKGHHERVKTVSNERVATHHIFQSRWSQAWRHMTWSWGWPQRGANSHLAVGWKKREKDREKSRFGWQTSGQFSFPGAQPSFQASEKWERRVKKKRNTSPNLSTSQQITEATVSTRGLSTNALPFQSSPFWF